MSNYSTAMPGIVIQSLQSTGLLRLRVVSNSMFPFLQQGDWVIVKSLQPGSSPRIGDIVLFQRGNDFIIHRIIRLTSQAVICKGDFNRTCDFPLRYDQILGILQKVEKGKMRFSMQSAIIQYVNRILAYFSAYLALDR